MEHRNYFTFLMHEIFWTSKNCFKSYRNYNCKGSCSFNTIDVPLIKNVGVSAPPFFINHDQSFPIIWNGILYDEIKQINSTDNYVYIQYEGQNNGTGECILINIEGYFHGMLNLYSVSYEILDNWCCPQKM